jgi:hypothetical protein
VHDDAAGVAVLHASGRGEHRRWPTGSACGPSVTPGQ